MRSAESNEHVPPMRVDRTLACRYNLTESGEYEVGRSGERVVALSAVPIGAGYNPQHEHGPRPIYDFRPESFSHCPPRAPSSANLDRFTEPGNEHDRILDEIIRARPRQLSAEEVGVIVQSHLGKGKSNHKRDAIHDFLLRALAFALFGTWPSDPSEVAAQRAAMRDCAAFGSMRELLLVYAAGSPDLGRGTISYRVAESVGRTTAGWNEVKCQPTHSGGSTARGEESVDRFLDAQAAIQKAKLTTLEHEMLAVWLIDPPKNEDGRINWPLLMTRWRLLMWRDGGGRLDKIAGGVNGTQGISQRNAAIAYHNIAPGAGTVRLRARVKAVLSDPGPLPPGLAVDLSELVVARLLRASNEQVDGIAEKFDAAFKSDQDRAIRAANDATKETSDRALKASMTRLRARVETVLSDPGTLPKRLATDMVEPIVARPLLRHRPPPAHHAPRVFASPRFGQQSSFSLGSF